ncbi:MAG: hypothetical protein AABX29_01955 [Nanoarchaeota archaeon]
MARTAREPTQKDLDSALEISGRFSDVPKDLNQQIELVRSRYPSIGGVPVELLDEKKLYRIAERLLTHSNKLVKQDRLQEAILSSIERLTQTRDLDQREILEERICIQLENFPDNHYLVRRYEQAKKVKNPF